MNTCLNVSRSRSNVRPWMGRFYTTVAISALGTILFPMTAGAHPDTRQGFFIGLGVARGSMGETSQGYSRDRVSGTGGTFRFGYAINPNVALGLENNSFFASKTGSVDALGTSTIAVSIFPTRGLVLRAGIGAGYGGSADDGLSGDFGMGWTAGGAYEFRVARTFAIGPQIDYAHASFQFSDINYINFGLSMNWYFIRD
jgi:hypothetical protein